VTVSVFILSGPQLKATVTLEGPFAGPEVDSGRDLHAKIIEYTNGKNNHNPDGRGHLSFTEEVDFEHLNEDGSSSSSSSLHGAGDLEDDDEIKKPILPDDPDAEKKRRERRDKQRKKFLDQKQKQEERRLELQRKIRNEGDPFLHTAKAPAAGWYRFCVHSAWNQASDVTISLYIRLYCTGVVGGHLDDAVTWESKYHDNDQFAPVVAT
jgi:hypothetical protein